ncbi:MAG: hypothetical protein ACPLY7_01780, partial [Microgenomates group bacterium]
MDKPNPLSKQLPPLPSDDKIAVLSELIRKNFQEQKRSKRYASVKHVLSMLGTGSLLIATLIAPGAARLWKEIEDERKKQAIREWKMFNVGYLRRTIERLQKQKLVEVTR